jgi:hypothetical protein
MRHRHQVFAPLQRVVLCIVHDVRAACVQRRRTQRFDFNATIAPGPKIKDYFKIALSIFVQGHHRDCAVCRFGCVGP